MKMWPTTPTSGDGERFERGWARRRVIMAAIAGLVVPSVVVPAIASQTAAAEVTPASAFVATTEAELRAAVRDANGPTTIMLAPGTYVLTASLTIGRDLEIIGAGPSDKAADYVIDANGGAAFVVDARVSLKGITITRASKPNGTGAAITVRSGKLTLVDSSIENNSAREGAGITIAKNASAEVRRSTFVGNRAERKGGGIRVDGHLDLINSTFTENVGQSGGAISVAGTAAISFSTFVDNSSNNQKGAGVDRNGGTMVITGSILTQADKASSDGSDCSGNPSLIGPNYVGNALGCNPDGSVLVGTVVGDLQLDPLADNLGPTRTMAIAEGGLAVERADANQCKQIGLGPSGPTLGAAIATDQRGIVRPQPLGGKCDLGAYEIADLAVGVDLTSDTNPVFVGAELLPADAIASSVIANDRLFGDTLAASPLNAFPLEAAPLNAFPLNAFPLNAFPLNAFPLNAFGTAAAPLNAFPLNAFPLNAFPLNAFPLSDLVLTEGTWEELLAGTEFEGVPIQSLTLGDVINVGGVQSLSLGQLNLEGTPLNAFPLNAFLLQSVPLNAFPLNAFDTDIAEWCDVVPDFCSLAGPEFDPNDPNMSLASLALAGVPLNAFPLNAFPLNAFPLNAFPLNAFPLNAFPLNAFQWQASPLNAFPLNAFPLNAFGEVLDCGALPGGTCDGATLGDAAGAGAFLPGATLDDLGNLFQTYPDALLVLEQLGITLADLLAGVIPADSIPWEQLDLSTLGLQNAADPAKWTFRYEADVSLTKTAETLTLDLTLPQGFAYATTGTTIDGVAVDPAAVSLRCADATSTDCLDASTVVVIELANVGGGEHRLSIPARAGFVVREGAVASVDVTATAGSNTASASDDHTVDVIAPDGAAPRPIVQNGDPCGGEDGDANLGWTTTPTPDVDLFSFVVSQDAARCGLRADIFLSNLPVDFDLTLYGPVTAPLRGAPTASMGYLDDVALDLNPFDDEIQADTVQDIPQRLPDGIAGVDPDAYAVVAISSNRNQYDERIRTGTLREGTYFIQVSAYNGVSSNEPYALRMRTDASVAPLVCEALPAPTAPAGSRPAPAELPAGVNTLFLVNEQLLTYTYGATARSDVVAAAQRVADAADLGVIGAVIAVDDDPEVQAAYAARFADPCDPFAANDVVRKIGEVIDEYTAVHDTIENIVIVGDDRQIPMANIVDDANFANERTFSQEFDVANESTAALTAGTYRSDDPYGTDAGLRIRDHELFLPTRAVGRLVESPADIIATLDRFVTFGGQLDDDATRTAFQSGYDFLQDGAELNADNLTAAGFDVDPLFVDASDASTLWSDDDVVTALGSRYDVIGLHAHFDENNALPAEQDENGILAQDELLRSDELPATVDSSVVYSMGCHSGWSYSDVQVGRPAPDWAQELTGVRQNVFVGNTGFGYGDTERIALTEQLTALFADEVGRPGSVGAAWVAAKQRMAGDLLVVDAYQEKALQQFVFYGLPMFHLDAAPPDLSSSATAFATASLVAQSEPELEPAPGGGSVLPVDAFNPFGGTDDAFVLTETPDGDYYSVNGDVLTVNGHPVQPLRTVDVPAVGGMRAQDALIVDLSSQDVGGAFDPLFFWASPNFGGPRPEWTDGSFPAEMAAVRTSRVRGQTQQQVLLAAGQYRASDTVPNSGTQRLHTYIGAEVYYVPDTVTDFTAPLITQSRGFVDDDAVLFEIDVDATAQRVYVLYRAEGAIDWQGVDLVDDGAQWRGVGPFSAGGAQQAEFIVQAVDEFGNVAMSNSKSQYFLAAAPGDVSNLALTATGPTKNTSGWFTGDVTVTADNDDAGAIVYRIDAGQFTSYIGPVVLDSAVAGTHLVTAIDTTGAFAALTVPIDATPPVAAVEVPIAWSRDPVTVTFDATDEGSGVDTIHYTLDGSAPTTSSPVFDPASPPTVSAEGVTAKAIAIDVAGNVSDVAAEPVRIDRSAQAPTLQLSGLDANGAVGAGGTATANFACTDSLSGVASCVLTVDGVVRGNATSATLPTDVLGAHTVVVTATDNAGNTATTSATYTVDDRTPPTATLSLSGTTFGLSTLSTTFPVATFSCADAPPSSGLTSCQLRVFDHTGAEVASSTGSPYALPATLLTAPSDQYTVVVSATDVAGNASATSSATATYRIVDDIAPSASLVNLTIDQSSAGGPVTADYSCADNVGIATCVLQVRNSSGTVIFTDSSNGNPKTVALPSTTTGTYTVTVTATDTWGNQASVTDTYTFAASICFNELYDFRQTKTIGTNYTIRIDLCTPATLDPRQIQLRATAIVDDAGNRFEPGPNDSGNANTDAFVFRYIKKDGFVYNLNTTGFDGTPAPGGTLYYLVFDVIDIRTQSLLGVGRARFTLTP